MPANTTGGDYQGTASGRWNKDAFISVGVLLPPIAFDEVPASQLMLAGSNILPNGGTIALAVPKSYPLDFTFNYPQNVRVNNSAGTDFDCLIEGFDSYNSPIRIVVNSLGGASDEVTAGFTKITNITISNLTGPIVFSVVVGLGIGLRHPLGYSNTSNIFLINHVANSGGGPSWVQGLGALVSPVSGPEITDQRGIYLQDVGQAAASSGYRISYLTSKLYSVRADG